MTKKQSRRKKFIKQCQSMRAKGYDLIGGTWLRIGSTAYEKAVEAKRKPRR